MNIRPYTPDDESQVIQLWIACDLVKPQNNPLQDIQRKLRINPEWFLVGEMDRQVVATSMVGYDGHRGWIYYLAVAPEYQRQGFASAIMNHGEQLLREAGCPKINLQVRSTNQAVIDFYRAIGFGIDEVLSLGKRLEIDTPYEIGGDDE